MLILGKHDPSRNDYQNSYQKNRYKERMTEAKKTLGGKCSVCGTTRNLELDHKNPASKAFTVSKLWSVPDAEFKKEVKKCRLLCRKHHLENSGKQREKGTVKSEKGKSQYDSKNRKKASPLHAALRLTKLADKIDFRSVAKRGANLAKSVASKHDIDCRIESNFDKTKSIGEPILVWNAFRQDNGIQVIFTVYGKEKDRERVDAVVKSVKSSLPTAGASLDYEDDRKEPGLAVKTVSGIFKT